MVAADRSEAALGNPQYNPYISLCGDKIFHASEN